MKHVQMIAASLLCAITAGCSTTKPVAPSKAPDSAASSLHASNFDIAYNLGGHGEHRLTGSSSSPASGGEPHVATFDEREVVDEDKVNAEGYGKFVAHLLSFAQKTQRAPSQEAECRSPYSISIKIDGKTYTSKGCRDDDGGDFAKLVREGEFLLYSKK
jgi:hypothetical protein